MDNYTTACGKAKCYNRKMRANGSQYPYNEEKIQLNIWDCNMLMICKLKEDQKKKKNTVTLNSSKSIGPKIWLQQIDLFEESKI